MIRLLDAPADHVLAFRIEGPPDADAIDAMLQQLGARLAGDDPLRAYIELVPVNGVSAGRLMKDLGHAFDHLGALVQRFERVAVVTESKILRTAVKAQGKLLGGAETRAFSPKRQADAREWIAE